MNEHDILNRIDALMDETMTKIAEAASKQDLAALEDLTRRAAELKQMKEQISAIDTRLCSMQGDQPESNLAAKPEAGLRPDIEIEVSQGMINQNLLTLTDALRRGTIRAGEEMTIEAFPSRERFRTHVMSSGNKLQERGAVGRFFREAQVSAGDHVLLEETSPGKWSLRKRGLVRRIDSSKDRFLE
jgi:hypothetical protein